MKVALLMGLCSFLIFFGIGLKVGLYRLDAVKLPAYQQKDPARILMMPEAYREICFHAGRISRQWVACGPELQGENKGWFWLYRTQKRKDYANFWEEFEKLKKDVNAD